MTQGMCSVYARRAHYAHKETTITDYLPLKRAHICTYLTPYSRSLLAKLTVATLHKIFPALHGIRRLITIKNTLIVPTDAHYYNIIEMLKQFQIIRLAPTCFGSRRNHHRGAVLCLAKTTNMVCLCASV